MDKLLCKMPCLSTSKVYKHKEIHENLFDKKVDKRYLESSVQRFIILNKKMLDFLGITYDLRGTGSDISLSFTSSSFIGAIPVRMPYDGIAHKDFQITPRFENSEDVFSEITQLLSCLDYSIKPEYSATDLLCFPMQLKPPTYYEAIKYIDLFEKAYRYKWVKFDIKNRKHPYPKASTNWAKYALASYDPRNTLVFPARDSVLTTNHKEWQELKYVFDIAKEQITNPTVPGSIRYKYDSQIKNISNKVQNIKSSLTDEVLIRSGDPQCIKDAKSQANVLLKRNSDTCSAWRIDMAELFERYVQYIVEQGIRELSGIVIPNGKIYGRGGIPSWGLKYLEPDIMVKVGDRLYMADAKYKANFLAIGTSSEVLKETHRADLHQLLAYCSFEPQFQKTGILFYPASRSGYRELEYVDRMGGACNKIVLFGIAFGIEHMPEAISMIKALFHESMLPQSAF